MKTTDKNLFALKLYSAILLTATAIGCSNQQEKKQLSAEELAERERAAEERWRARQPKLIEATEICAAFAKNPGDAEKTYKGKRFKIAGTVANRGTELGSHFIYFDKGESGCEIKCLFAKTEENFNKLVSLHSGKSVWINGTIGELKSGLILLKNCELD